MGEKSPAKSQRGASQKSDSQRSPEKREDARPNAAGTTETPGPAASPLSPSPGGAPTSRILPREAPRSSPVVPSLNLSNIKERKPTVNRGDQNNTNMTNKAIDESVVYSDSKVINEAARRREMETFKVKVKEQRDKESKTERDREWREGQVKEWAYLTSSNLKEFAKVYSDPSSRHHGMQRVKQWIQQSNPPYETNPPPGVPALTTSTNRREKTLGFGSLWSCCGFSDNPRR